MCLECQNEDFGCRSSNGSNSTKNLIFSLKFFLLEAPTLKVSFTPISKGWLSFVCRWNLILWEKTTLWDIMKIQKMNFFTTLTNDPYLMGTHVLKHSKCCAIWLNIYVGVSLGLRTNMIFLSETPPHILHFWTWNWYFELFQNF